MAAKRKAKDEVLCPSHNFSICLFPDTMVSSSQAISHRPSPQPCEVGIVPIFNTWGNQSSGRSRNRPGILSVGWGWDLNSGLINSGCSEPPASPTLSSSVNEGGPAELCRDTHISHDFTVISQLLFFSKNTSSLYKIKAFIFYNLLRLKKNQVILKVLNKNFTFIIPPVPNY